MTNTQSPAPGVAANHFDHPSEFREGQWWVEELDKLTEGGTDDQKRAMAVVHHLLKSIAATPAEPVGTLHIQHYLNAPEMENREYVPIVDLPPGSHKLYIAPPLPSPAPQAAGADTKRLNFLSQRGGMIITSDDENNRWHVEVLGGTDSEGEQIVTVYEGVTLRMAIDAAYEGVTGAAITASGRDAS